MESRLLKQGWLRSNQAISMHLFEGLDLVKVDPRTINSYMESINANSDCTLQTDTASSSHFNITQVENGNPGWLFKQFLYWWHLVCTWLLNRTVALHLFMAVCRVPIRNCCVFLPVSRYNFSSSDDEQRWLLPHLKLSLPEVGTHAENSYHHLREKRRN